MAGSQKSSSALDLFPTWLFANAGIYLAVLTPGLAIYIYFGRRGIGRSLSDFFVEAFLALPGIAIEMIIPTIFVLSILWNVRLARSVWFRLISLLTLSLPCIFSQDLAEFLFIASVQVAFSQLMLPSRSAEW